jgi:hypothetical protein
MEIIRHDHYFLLTKRSEVLITIILLLFLLGISDTLPCPELAPSVKTVPLLDGHQLLMLSVRTVTHLKTSFLFLIIFQNVSFFIFNSKCIQ